ncbi:BZ3500_MvSof-1268-A1-R1_Chr6-1g08402 [Microbotryum saponariae]|uniref:BZ3500_MvSof-1268-A1-R1_Chr6-1g08402 protein n=1 Tax=Microbotryum saponariae TaxID=289078 RepID=A0A2X0KK54_9BASI|nr:BZ3500_MvSof-1268-A1-R1_Chr6-1g08402 [Microbotryum saponariae]SDA07686.1 BZ3501_MvSof-1269-A2-R1_Chr6-1g08123 [Microbotryum saponariae]
MSSATGIESLPIELIYRCIDLTRPHDPEHRRARHIIKQLVPLTLVAKRWRDYAQQCLFENVMLIGPRDVEKYGDALEMLQGRFDTCCLIITADVTRPANRALTVAGLEADAKYAELISRVLYLTTDVQELRLVPKITVAPAVLMFENLSGLEKLTLECCFSRLEPDELEDWPFFQLESFTFIPAAGLAQSSQLNMTTMAFVEYVLSRSMWGTLKHLDWRPGYVDLVQPEITERVRTASESDVDTNVTFSLFPSRCYYLRTFSTDVESLRMLLQLDLEPTWIQHLILRQVSNILSLLHLLEYHKQAFPALRTLRVIPDEASPRGNNEDWAWLEENCESRGIELVREASHQEASAW